MQSPRRKKTKLTDSPSSSKAKRTHEIDEEPSKRIKSYKLPKEDIQAKRRKNFIQACELVSYKAYYDQRSRFQLAYLPACSTTICCSHLDHKVNSNLKPLPPYIEESFKIEMKTNMWNEALEVCILCINPDQFLPANVLKDIVEIMLNAHDNEYTEFSIENILNKCQLILEMNFSHHPPCLVKTLRKCYNDFLTSPMDSKENTFSNRSQFGYDKGVVKYCLNRLEHEISQESKDEPLIDRYETTPEDMRQSVKGLHWQKEKLEIYELLPRVERIERLMAVLDSIIELLQFDLAIWHSRYTNNLGSHIMRSHKPLMAYLLWSNNVLYTGAVNNNCRQILRLFIYLIHLQYPEEHLTIITKWLNVMIQTFYICENNSNNDYPNTGKYSTAFANEFLKLISDFPQETVICILERIRPDYMQCLLGTLHIKKLLHTVEENPIVILRDFLKHEQWKQHPESENKLNIKRKKDNSFKNYKDLFHFLNKKCEVLLKQDIVPPKNSYAKMEHELKPTEKPNTLNYIVHILFITLEAYLDAYSVQSMQETLEALNDQIDGEIPSPNNTYKIPEFCSYSVTEHFIKKYRTIYQILKELILLLQEKKDSGKLPDAFKVFQKIGLLSL